MTRARRLQTEQQELAIEQAGVLARKFWYRSRRHDPVRPPAENARWMWFYLLLQAQLSDERTVQ